MHWKFICGLIAIQFAFSLAACSKPILAQEMEEKAVPIIRFLEASGDVNLIQLTTPNGQFSQAASAFMTVRGDGNSRMVYHSFSPVNQPLVDYLAAPNIQEQIDLSKEQKNQFNAIRKRLQEGFATLDKRYHQRTDVKASKKIRDEMTQEFQKKIKELRRDLEEEVKETLVPHQINLIQRMKFQKAVQIYGFTHAVSNAPFNEEIETTDEQKKELAKIKMETEKAIQEKIAEMRNAGKEKMLKALDKSQRKKIKELEGDSEKRPSTKL